MCLLVCESHYTKTTERISVKFGRTTGLSPEQIPLTFNNGWIMKKSGVWYLGGWFQWVCSIWCDWDPDLNKCYLILDLAWVDWRGLLGPAGRICPIVPLKVFSLVMLWIYNFRKMSFVCKLIHFLLLLRGWATSVSNAVFSSSSSSDGVLNKNIIKTHRARLFFSKH